MHTSVTKVTNVPTVIFVSMVAKVTTGRRCYIYPSAVQTFAGLFNTSWLPGLPPIWHRTTFCLRRCLTHVHIMKRRSVICLSAESRRIGGEEVQLHSFLSFELDGALLQGKKPGTEWTWGSRGSRACLDALEKYLFRTGIRTPELSARGLVSIPTTLLRLVIQ
jgi:hypothetical protein